MLRGLTRAGIGNIGSDENFIRLAAQYGFGAVDIDAKAFIDQVGLSRAKEILVEHQMKIGSIGLSVEWRTSDEQFRAGLKKLEQEAEAAAQLGCTSCCTYILPSTDQKPASFMAAAINRFRMIADILDAHGVRLGLEFVGPHHLRTTWSNPFIWTVEETLEMIEAINNSNVGLLIDAYHCHTTGFGAADILNLKPHQIVHAHINDARDLPVEQLLDNDRLYPGEGVIDLCGFVNSLQQIGYTGAVSQEILTPEQPTAPSEELLARSQAGFDKVMPK
ncbi:sugar phosphate isomerase/epimerase family protein [Paenibacillus marinisediminis]